MVEAVSSNLPDPALKHFVRLHLNGRIVEDEIDARTSLLEFVRQHGAKGSHTGCEQGVCGACTVLLDGEPVRSCLVLAVQATDAVVPTVESLGDAVSPHPLQQAFSRERSLQCGFCTPGFLMLASSLLSGPELVSRELIREVLSSNLCRCTGYETIVRAVEQVAAAQGLLTETHPPKGV